MESRETDEEVVENDFGNGDNLSISERAIELSTAFSVSAYIIVLFIVWVTKLQLSVAQGDIYPTVQIAAGLGAISLTIPLFLRDFTAGKIVWKSFLTISSLFLLSTSLGVIAYLLQTESRTISLTFLGFLGLVLTLACHAGVSGYRASKENSHCKVYVLPSRLFDFIFVGIFAFFSYFASDQNFLTAFLLLFGYGLVMLGATLIGSITSLIFSNPVSTSERVESAIEKVLNQNADKALTKQELTHKLRHGPFSDEMELISKDIVEEAAKEMTGVRGRERPKANLVNSKYFPRWSNEFEQAALNSAPGIVVEDTSQGNNSLISQISAKQKEALIAELSKRAGLSEELLTEGNIISAMEPYFDNTDLQSVVTGQSVFYKPEVIQTSSLDSDDISFGKVEDFFKGLEERSYFPASRNMKEAKILAKFAEEIILHDSDKIAEKIAELSNHELKKLTKREDLREYLQEYINDQSGWVREDKIYKYVWKLLIPDGLTDYYRATTLFSKAREKVKEIIVSELKELVDIGKLETKEEKVEKNGFPIPCVFLRIKEEN